jgi:MFS family permease
VVGGVIGAGIAGLLFGVFGSAPIGFAIDAATFLISFAFISRIAASAGEIRGEEHAAARNTGMLSSIRAGLDVVRGSRVLAGITMASAVTMLGLGAVNVLFVPLIVDDLGVSPTWMAGIDLAQTIGMLGAAALVTTLVRRIAPTSIITLGLVGIGVCIGLMAGVSSVWQVLVILVAVGLFVTPLQAMVQTLVQTSAGDATRGRVVSLLQAATSTASVTSMAIGGVMADLTSLRTVFLAASVVVLMAAGVAVVMFRGVRRPERAMPAAA